MGWTIDDEQLRKTLTDYAKEANCYKDSREKQTETEKEQER